MKVRNLKVLKTLKILNILFILVNLRSLVAFTDFALFKKERVVERTRLKIDINIIAKSKRFHEFSKYFSIPIPINLVNSSTK